MATKSKLHRAELRTKVETNRCKGRETTGARLTAAAAPAPLPSSPRTRHSGAPGRPAARAIHIDDLAQPGRRLCTEGAGALGRSMCASAQSGKAGRRMSGEVGGGGGGGGRPHLELTADGEEDRRPTEEDEQRGHKKVAHRPQRVGCITVVKPACVAAGGGTLGGDRRGRLRIIDWEPLLLFLGATRSSSSTLFDISLTGPHRSSVLAAGGAGCCAG